MEIENLRVHHDLASTDDMSDRWHISSERVRRGGVTRAHLPGIDGQIGIVETPIERLGRYGLIARVVIRREVLVRERLSRVDTFPRVKHEHLLEEVERERVGTAELLRERDSFPFRQGLNESEGLGRKKKESSVFTAMPFSGGSNSRSRSRSFG